MSNGTIIRDLEPEMEFRFKDGATYRYISHDRAKKNNRWVTTYTCRDDAGETHFFSRRKMNSHWDGIVIADESDEPTPTPSPATANDILDGSLAELIAKAVQPFVKGTLDEKQVIELIDDRLGKLNSPNLVEVKQLDGETKDMGLQHPKFEAILRLVSQRMHIWLAGPAGSGKTTVAAAVAKALDLPFYCTSVCAQTSEAKLMGYNSVSDGTHVRSLLREAYEFGGVFLLDECDSGNAGILTVVNQLMSNPQVGFQDAVVDRHPDFVLIAGANTFGSGANRQYVGRNQLDAATLDRFIMMDYGYDPNIEAAMCGVPASAFNYESPQVEFVDTDDEKQVQKRCVEICKKIGKIREAIAELRIRHIVSPRATSNACKMTRVGFSQRDILEMAVWKGLDKDSVTKIQQVCR